MSTDFYITYRKSDALSLTAKTRNLLKFLIVFVMSTRLDNKGLLKLRLRGMFNHREICV